MKFDGTMTWGIILGLSGLFITLIGMLINFNNRVKDMEVKLDLIFDWWRKMWEPTMPIPSANVLRKKFRRHIHDSKGDLE